MSFDDTRARASTSGAVSPPRFFLFTSAPRDNALSRDYYYYYYYPPGSISRVFIFIFIFFLFFFSYFRQRYLTFVPYVK